MVVQVYNTVTIQCACAQWPAPLSDSRDVVRDTFVSLRALRCVTFLSPERYNQAVHNISGCIYNYNNYISLLYLYISGCTYISPAVLISPAVFIYLRLYLYISRCTYNYISGCTYNLQLYLYISGCTFISPAVLIYLPLYL